jgi:hypothetical protein
MQDCSEIQIVLRCIAKEFQFSNSRIDIRSFHLHSFDTKLVLTVQNIYGLPKQDITALPSFRLGPVQISWTTRMRKKTPIAT